MKETVPCWLVVWEGTEYEVSWLQVALPASYFSTFVATATPEVGSE